MKKHPTVFAALALLFAAVSSLSARIPDVPAERVEAPSLRLFVEQLEKDLSPPVLPEEAASLVRRFRALSSRLGETTLKTDRDSLQGRLDAIGQRLGWQEEREGTAAGLAGTVQAGATGEPLSDQEILVFSAQLFLVTTTRTAADGKYFVRLSPGDYFVAVAAKGPYLTSFFAESNCGAGCPAHAGSRLPVESTGVTRADFSLEASGRIVASVVDARNGQPIPFTQARVYSADLSTYRIHPVENGLLDVALTPGSYRLFFQGVEELADQFHDGIPCLVAYNHPLCDAQNAALIEVVDQGVKNVRVNLVPGGSISGRAVDEIDQHPLENAEIWLLSQSPSSYDPLRFQNTDAMGRFQFEGLPAGTYRATMRPGLIENGHYYTGEIYRDRTCLSQCDLQMGPADGIELLPGSRLENLDFHPKRFGWLAGVVSDSRSGQPISGAEPRLIRIATGEGTRRAGPTDSSGSYFFSEPYAPGLYHLIATAPGYLPLDSRDPGTFNGDPSRGLPVEIAPGIYTHHDFKLDPAPHLDLHLTNKPANDSSCRLVVWRRSEQGAIERRFERPCATDFSFELDRIGTFFVGAYGSTFASTLKGAGACYFDASRNYCDFSRATPFSLGVADRAQVDLTLETGAALEIRPHLPEFPPTQARIRVEDEAGRPIFDQYADSFRKVLPPAIYYFAVLGAPTLENKVYPDRICSSFYCDPQEGDPIQLSMDAPRIFDVELRPLANPGTCLPGSQTACVQQSRFQIEAKWKNFQSESGVATLLPLGGEATYGYFFSPSNIELLVKVLNACSPELGRHFWVFANGLTNVEVELRVRDTWTGAEKLYHNPLGQVFEPIIDQSSFATCGASLPLEAPLPELDSPLLTATPREASLPATLATYCTINTDPTCIAGRYSVKATYVTPDGSAGAASRIQLSNDAKAYYFFSLDNIELLVKVLDGCQQNGHFWFFAAGLTDLEVGIELKDLATGHTFNFRSPPGPFRSILDLTTFPCASP